MDIRSYFTRWLQQHSVALTFLHFYVFIAQTTLSISRVVAYVSQCLKLYFLLWEVLFSHGAREKPIVGYPCEGMIIIALPLCLVQTQHWTSVNIKWFYWTKLADVHNLIAVTIGPGTLVTLPVPSGSYCVLEFPTNTDLMYSEVRYANELDILDPVMITTTDNNNSGVSIMTTDGIITPSFAAAIIAGCHI